MRKYFSILCLLLATNSAFAVLRVGTAGRPTYDLNTGEILPAHHLNLSGDIIKISYDEGLGLIILFDSEDNAVARIVVNENNRANIEKQLELAISSHSYLIIEANYVFSSFKPIYVYSNIINMDSHKITSIEELDMEPLNYGDYLYEHSPLTHFGRFIGRKIYDWQFN